MALANLVPIPSAFTESFSKHLYREAEIIIIKKLRNFLAPGANETETEHTAFQREYAEFLKQRRILRQLKDWDRDFLDNNGDPLYTHYAVLATSSPAIGNLPTLANVDSDRANMDVISVQTTTSTQDRGRCTIVINSRQEKYIFSKNPFRLGQALFTSNDLILVNLPGLDNQLYRSFTGFVTSVQVETILGDTLQTHITLECEDMLKQLTQSRTAQTPSANVAEAKGEIPNGLVPQWSGKLAHDVLADIMTRACSDFYTVTADGGFLEKISEIRNAANNNPSKATEKALEEFQLVEKHVARPKPLPDSYQVSDSKLAVVLGSRDQAVVERAGILAGTQLSKKSISIPKRIVGLRTASGASDASIVSQEASGDFGVADVNLSQVAYVIDGTSQKGYSLAVSNSIGPFVTDWRSGLSVCRDIADGINFELFADETGVIRFRPINVTIPADVKPGGLLLPTTRTAGSRVGAEFWLDQKYIAYQNYTDTDDRVFTIAYVTGTPEMVQDQKVFAAVAVDVLGLLRLGARVAPIKSIQQIIDRTALQAYALAYLNRINAGSSTAQITYIGDARLKAGNPVYIKHRNSIYYIESVTHSFVAGQGYQTTLNLTYGRRPLATAGDIFGTTSIFSNITDSDLLKIVVAKDKDVVLDDLNRMDAGPALAGAEKGLAERFGDYIRQNESHLTFQGYIWEPMFQMSFEELANTLAFQIFQNARTEIGQNGNVGSSIVMDKAKQLDARQQAVTGIPMSRNEKIQKSVKANVKTRGLGGSKK